MLRRTTLDHPSEAAFVAATMDEALPQWVTFDGERRFPVGWAHLTTQRIERADAPRETRRFWLVACPYCGLLHEHPAGWPHEDALDFIGLRHALCTYPRDPDAVRVYCIIPRPGQSRRPRPRRQRRPRS